MARLIHGPIYIFDIDGVILINLDSVYHHHTAREVLEDWYYGPLMEALGKVRPRRIGIELLISRAKLGKVVLVTGRPERLRRITVVQLKEVGVYGHISALLMREDANRDPEWVIKPSLVSKYLEDPLLVKEVHDDNEMVLNSYAKLFPHAKLYLHLPKGYMEYQLSEI